MIKLNFYVRRKPGMTDDEFRTHWSETHGPLWAESADILGVRRYTQIYDSKDHPAALALRQGYSVEGEPYDGYSVACWSEISVLEAALATKEGQAAWDRIFEDEKAFVDHPHSMLSFGTDHPVINPAGKMLASEESDLVRGAYFPHGLEGIELSELQRHWIAIHGGLAHDFSEYSPNIRYFQVHRVEQQIADRMRSVRGMQSDPRYFGHAEIWTSFPVIEEKAAHPRRQELFPIFIADIEAFCEMSEGYFIIGKEKHFVDKDIYTMPLPQPEFTTGLKQNTGT